MTCADYRDLKFGGYAAFERLKREMGVRDCPKCKTPIQKSDGCNHMTCLACKSHMCWVCLMVFPSGAQVYKHMSLMHGGHVDFGGH